jgi:hypothetical protein
MKELRKSRKKMMKVQMKKYSENGNKKCLRTVKI